MAEEFGLRVENLRKTFNQGEVIGVENESYDLKPGEFFTLVGPSGCGKSTTLNCVAGLEVPDHGHIEISGETVFESEDGEILTNQEPDQRNIGMVFQSYAIYPHMTVKDNIGFPLEIQDYDDDVIEEKVEEIAEMVGLGELLDRKPGQLSGGQRQRVALARALNIEPDIFLLDEPLANLDAKLRVQMRAELARLHKNLEITVLYVTHDQEEAMSLSDRIAVMNDGRIEQIGTPAELFNEPTNHFVADFIGSPSMNLFNVDIIEEDDSLYFKFDEEKIKVPKSYISELEDYVNEEVELGLRPQDTQMVESDGDFNVEAVVDVVETIGAERLVHSKAVNTDVDVITKKGNIESGDEFYIKFTPRKMHVFDLESGQAIANVREYA